MADILGWNGFLTVSVKVVVLKSFGRSNVGRKPYYRITLFVKKVGVLILVDVF